MTAQPEIPPQPFAPESLKKMEAEALIKTGVIVEIVGPVLANHVVDDDEAEDEKSGRPPVRRLAVNQSTIPFGLLGFMRIFVVD